MTKHRRNGLLQAPGFAQQALALRDALPAAVRAAAAEAIAVRPFPVKFERGTIVSGFSPMRSEINPLPLDAKVARRRRDGSRCLAIAGRGKATDHARLAFGEPLASGQWGIREPMPEAAEVAPDILIVPLAGLRPRTATASVMAPATTT